MGIEDFRVAPDNKGGRPTKEEQEEEEHSGLRSVGDPFYPAKDTEEYWREIWDRYVDGEDPSSQDIASICDYTHLFPWDVKVYIEKWGIYEFDWFQMPEDYPPHSYLKFLLEDEGISNDFTSQVASTDTGEEITGGWAEIINDAKET